MIKMTVILIKLSINIIINIIIIISSSSSSSNINIIIIMVLLAGCCFGQGQLHAMPMQRLTKSSTKAACQ